MRLQHRFSRHEINSVLFSSICLISSHFLNFFSKIGSVEVDANLFFFLHVALNGALIVLFILHRIGFNSLYCYISNCLSKTELS